ncbi:Ig-like domain-containing protein [Leifsonia sp. AG29]|uniref:Ig-like domain-containing protein n=1 Tax=Leifsonia sp. AG29 TaxID=2598860 RepID=UPI00131C482B|nr:Ig-like domain-containing protein [Leifsonia sp. AG29]
MKTRRVIIGTGVAIALACGSVTPALAAPAHLLAATPDSAPPDAVLTQLAQTVTPTIRPGGTGKFTVRISSPMQAVGLKYTITAPTGTTFESGKREWKSSRGTSGSQTHPLSADKRTLTLDVPAYTVYGPDGWVDDTYTLRSDAANPATGPVGGGLITVTGGNIISAGTTAPIGYTATKTLLEQVASPSLAPGATGNITFRFYPNGQIGTVYTLTAPTGTIWASTARSYKTSDGKTGAGIQPTLSADKRTLSLVGTGWGTPADGWIEDTYQLTSLPGNTSSGLIWDGALAVIGGAAIVPGTTIPVSYISTYDAPKPVGVTLSAPAAGAVITDTKRPVFSGKGQPGATVTITDNAGGQLASTVVAAGGTWSVVSSKDLYNGAYAGVVTQDVDSSTAAYVFRVEVPDNDKPADITAGTAGNGTAKAGTTVDAPISFTNTSGKDLFQGKITFTAPTGTKFAAQQSVPLDWRVAGSGGGFTRWSEADCQVESISADGRTMTCTVSPTTAGWNNGNEFRWSPKVAIDASTGSGPAVISARAEFGTASVTNTFRIDVTAVSVAPVALTAPTFGGTIQAAQPLFEGTGQPGATIEVKGSSGRTLASGTVEANGHWSATSTIALGTGRYIGTVTQTAGTHSSTAGFDFTVVKPTTPPALTSPAIGGKTAETRPTFTGTGHPGASIAVKGSSGRVLATATVSTAGTWSAASTLELAPGRYVGTITQDVGGQTSQVPFDFTIPHPLVLTSPQLGATIKELTPTFTGTGEPGASIEIRGNSGTVIANTTVGADTKWAATSKITLFEGRFIGTVTQDAGGVKTQTPFDYTIKK